MPFKSKQQERWAFATKQPFAKKWADMTNQKTLPKKKRKASARSEQIIQAMRNKKP